mmetsp:Transcript_44244/g.105368  ORF Transcript_44244/g.105368 Transcript_44244/m.105368 type:complete len:251 (+) Transcript_44244:665-1417(+)
MTAAKRTIAATPPAKPGRKWCSFLRIPRISSPSNKDMSPGIICWPKASSPTNAAPCSGKKSIPPCGGPCGPGGPGRCCAALFFMISESLERQTVSILSRLNAMHGAVAGLPIASGHTSVSEGSHAAWNSASVAVMFVTISAQGGARSALWASRHLTMSSMFFMSGMRNAQKRQKSSLHTIWGGGGPQCGPCGPSGPGGPGWGGPGRGPGPDLSVIFCPEPSSPYAEAPASSARSAKAASGACLAIFSVLR